MKALSLKQPFAELILQGRKSIELRRWNTHFRGEFLIHSSLTRDNNAMGRFGFAELPLGFIVGKASLVDVKEYEDEVEFNKDKDLHLATSDWGNYGFMLKDVGRLEPISAKGKLNFWEFERNIK